MRRFLGVVLAAALVAPASCAGQVPASVTTSTTEPVATQAPTTTRAPTTTTLAPSGGGTAAVPEQLLGLPVRPVTITDGDDLYALSLAVADTGPSRTQGLMNVDDLQDLDGMLFVWPEPTESGFWMEDVTMPLDIAFFTAAGELVGYFTMPMCDPEACPIHNAPGEFTYAVEVPAPLFSGLSGAATLQLGP